MGERGPQPLPTVIKARRGTLEASRVSAAEPQWPAIDPKVRPAELVGNDAIAEWNRLVPLLLAQALAPQVGRGELIALCNSWGVYMSATRELAKPGGWVTKAQSGYEMPSAWVAIRKTALSEYTGLCARFGLDPASAGKVTAKPVNPSDNELERKRAERRAAR